MTPTPTLPASSPAVPDHAAAARTPPDLARPAPTRLDQDLTRIRPVHAPVPVPIQLAPTRADPTLREVEATVAVQAGAGAGVEAEAEAELAAQAQDVVAEGAVRGLRPTHRTHPGQGLDRDRTHGPPHLDAQPRDQCLVRGHDHDHLPLSSPTPTDLVRDP